MKLVQFQDFGGQLNTRFIISHCLGDASQAGGANFDELERRCRLIRTFRDLAPASVSVQLEDADHAMLVGLLKAYKWQLVTIELRDIISGVVNSMEPPAVMLPPKPAANGIGEVANMH